MRNTPIAVQPEISITSHGKGTKPNRANVNTNRATGTMRGIRRLDSNRAHGLYWKTRAASESSMSSMATAGLRGVLKVELRAAF